MRAEMLDSQAQPATGPTRFASVVIVADDLTGACDSGVAFLTSGFPVRVVLHSQAPDLESRYRPQPAAVLAYTTETRNLSQSAAAVRVADAVSTLAHSHPNSILFKKIDSAARGNFGAETLAALEASQASLALVAPAFPHAERTVHSGILSVRDCSGQNSRISLRDQFSSLAPAQIAILRSDSEANLRLAIHQAIANGTRVLLCDTATQYDLEQIAVAGRHLPQPLVWAGSAGLARALARTLPAVTPDPITQHTLRLGRTLLFSGSPHPVTQLQLSRLEEKAPELKNSVNRIESDFPSDEEILNPFTAEPVAALILTGGDTAACVLKTLNASSIRLTGEIAPGIPWGYVEGGLADGCMVITKSGGFGDRDALINAFEFCFRRPT